MNNEFLCIKSNCRWSKTILKRQSITRRVRSHWCRRQRRRREDQRRERSWKSLDKGKKFIKYLFYGNIYGEDQKRSWKHWEKTQWLELWIKICRFIFHWGIHITLRNQLGRHQSFEIKTWQLEGRSIRICELSEDRRGPDEPEIDSGPEYCSHLIFFLIY